MSGRSSKPSRIGSDEPSSISSRSPSSAALCSGSRFTEITTAFGTAARSASSRARMTSSVSWVRPTKRSMSSLTSAAPEPSEAAGAAVTCTNFNSPRLAGTS